MSSFRKKLALILSERVLKYSDKLICKPNAMEIRLAERKHSAPRITLENLHPVSITMLSGFIRERVDNNFSYVAVAKQLRVDECESILEKMFLHTVAVPIPSILHRDFFECDVSENIVYEIWAPSIPISSFRRFFEENGVLYSNALDYIVDYRDLLSVLRTIVDNSSETHVYVVSKYSSPIFLSTLVKTISRESSTRIYISTNMNSEVNISAPWRNTYVINTRSHRKLLLVVFRQKGRWRVIGYRGSMNILLPGVDDYLEIVDDLQSLVNLTHGLIRSFLVY